MKHQTISVRIGAGIAFAAVSVVYLVLWVIDQIERLWCLVSRRPYPPSYDGEEDWDDGREEVW